MEDVLMRVREFAKQAHGNQGRKYTPEPYMVHPVRVMDLCREYTQSLSVSAAALLHDVLEDTPVTKDEMKTFLRRQMSYTDADYTMQLVIDLTDVYTKQAYPQWNRRKRKKMEADRIALTRPDAQTIKYADIIDNCIEIVQYDADFGPQFLRECNALLTRIPNGNCELFARAKQTVLNELSKSKTSNGAK